MERSLNDWLLRLESLHPKAIDLGLERCNRVYQRLGSPRPARQIWTVAGTNGKGSVTAYLSALLAATGRSVASYSSPHVVRFNERIRIDGVEARDEDIVRALGQVEQARGDVSLTFFEFTTLAAFLLFNERNLDAAVLEVGLGGRLDAVNLVDPDCALITAIGLDHQAFLGDDRESIAREKAGIMRPGKPVVIGDRAPPGVLETRAVQLRAPALLLGRDFDIEPVAEGCEYREAGARPVTLPLPPLSGAHQLDNLAIAVAGLLQLLPTAVEHPARLSEGIRAVSLTGRLQSRSDEPRLLLDVGHNPLAARAVADFLAEQADHDCRCVLGMLVDKDVEAVVSELSGQVRYWYCGSLAGTRGQTGKALAQRVRAELDRQGVTQASVQAFSDVAAALTAALDNGDPASRVLAFGSFQTVADALELLERRRSTAG